jgi:hypothetical protein
MANNMARESITLPRAKSNEVSGKKVKELSGLMVVPVVVGSLMNNRLLRIE